jgi:uncharacterized protein YjbI with pentapeptide repeats
MPRRLRPGNTTLTGRNEVIVRGDFATVRQDFTYKKLERQSLTGLNFKQSLFIGTLLKGCHFKAVRFDRCDFSGARFVNCTFEDCSFVPDEIRSCIVTGCAFERCEFRSAQWHGVVTTNTRFVACDFREAAIRESSFTSCELSLCLLKRSSVTVDRFSRCKFSKVDFGDCTALFLFFERCDFDRCRINAETLGFTYGLSESNLEDLKLLYLGKAQSKPSSATLVDDLINNYTLRRWHVGACVLQLNFHREMPLLALRALAAALDETLKGEIPLDWDEMHFLVQVLGQLQAEERLPLAGLWAVTARVTEQFKDSNPPSTVTAAELTLRQLDGLVLSILDEIKSFYLADDRRKQQIRLELRLRDRPNRSLAELIPDAVYAAFGSKRISLVESHPGSWVEIWQLGLSALVAVQISLILVNGVMRQLVRLMEHWEQLSEKFPHRKTRSQRVSKSSVSRRLPSLALQVPAVYARNTVPSLDMLARVDATLNALSVLSDDDLKTLAAYAADRIEAASISPVSRRSVTRAGLKRQRAD